MENGVIQQNPYISGVDGIFKINENGDMGSLNNIKFENVQFLNRPVVQMEFNSPNSSCPFVTFGPQVFRYKT
jgi:hypothetical protein